jgi:hypothetical protein
MRKNMICHDCKFRRGENDGFNCILLDTDAPVKDCDCYMPPAGRYDDINDIVALIREIAYHGMSTQQHDLNRIADIVGNTHVGKLAEMANSTGTYGNRNAGQVIYSILFKVWNYEQAVSFYNEHTLHLGAKYREVQKERDRLSSDYECALGEVQKLINVRDALTEELDTYKTVASEQSVSLIAKDDEITTLKAKLYDLMTAGA